MNTIYPKSFGYGMVGTKRLKKIKNKTNKTPILFTPLNIVNRKIRVKASS